MGICGDIYLNRSCRTTEDMEELKEKLHVCGSCYQIFDSESLLEIHCQQCGGHVEQSAVQTNNGVLDIKTESQLDDEGNRKQCVIGKRPTGCWQ